MLMKLFTLLALLVTSTAYQQPTALALPRRAFVASAVVTLVAAPIVAVAAEERQGIGLTPLNSLQFNYQGGDSPPPAQPDLDPNELQISYEQFLKLLTDKKIVRAEFKNAGRACYVQVEGVDKMVRIGANYPLEDPKGWSSPSFVIRSLEDKQVPYKYLVEGLGANVL